MNVLHNSSEAKLMSPEEAAEVAELWAARQRQREETAGHVSVQEVAEALQIPSSEVAGLLADLRSGRTRSDPISHSRRRLKIVLAIAATLTVVSAPLRHINPGFSPMGNLFFLLFAASLVTAGAAGLGIIGLWIGRAARDARDSRFGAWLRRQYGS